MAKYIIDIDAFKHCLDLLKGIKVNGLPYISVDDAKLLIDGFPKDPLDFDISKLMIKGDTQ